MSRIARHRVRALSGVCGVAIQRANLIEHYIAKQQMERDMRLAREIQQGLLPQQSPSIGGFDVAGLCEPADQTGGDTFDFFEMPGGRWMISVADATGHGIGPALVIAETRAMLRAVSLREGDVANILGTVNDLLCADLGGGRFVTCFCGMLNPSDAGMSFASAGHGPLLFYNRRSDSFSQVAATALPLGIMEQTPRGQAAQYRFETGDFAAITTDGFFESADRQGAQFGMARMMEALRGDRNLPAARMIENLRRAVEEFTHGAPQADDLTAVVIRKL